MLNDKQTSFYIQQCDLSLSTRVQYRLGKMQFQVAYRSTECPVFCNILEAIIILNRFLKLFTSKFNLLPLRIYSVFFWYDILNEIQYLIRKTPLKTFPSFKTQIFKTKYFYTVIDNIYIYWKCSKLWKKRTPHETLWDINVRHSCYFHDYTIDWKPDFLSLNFIEK